MQICSKNECQKKFQNIFHIIFVPSMDAGGLSYNFRKKSKKKFSNLCVNFMDHQATDRLLQKPEKWKPYISFSESATLYFSAKSLQKYIDEAKLVHTFMYDDDIILYEVQTILFKLRAESSTN